VGAILQQYGVCRDNPTPDLDRAAIFYVVNRSIKGGGMKQTVQALRKPDPQLKRGLDWVSTQLKGVHIEQLDFRDAILKYDTPNTTFLVDPPWPGSTHFEYDIEGRHRELFDLLEGARGQFVGVLQSTRPCVELVRKQPSLYWWKNHVRHPKEVLFASFPLPHETAAGIWEPLDPAKFGF
jgi:site-specific DNA-adenine methylase